MSLLAQRDYKALAILTANCLEAEDIKRAVEAYPGTIRMPGESELAFDVVPIEGRHPRQFSIDAPVFTTEECPSDLTARMTVIDRPGDQFEVILYDIWVM